jgi:hypothetical protein
MIDATTYEETEIPAARKVDPVTSKEASSAIDPRVVEAYGMQVLDILHGFPGGHTALDLFQAIALDRGFDLEDIIKAKRLETIKSYIHLAIKHLQRQQKIVVATDDKGALLKRQSELPGSRKGMVWVLADSEAEARRQQIIELSERSRKLREQAAAAEQVLANLLADEGLV